MYFRYRMRISAPVQCDVKSKQPFMSANNKKFNLHTILILIIILLAFTTHLRVLASSFLRFRDHTQGRTTVGRTPLDEWSARRRDLYLTTHNTHNRQTSMPPAEFELAIPAGERLQTHALDRSATGIGNLHTNIGLNAKLWPRFKTHRWPSYEVTTMCNVIGISLFHKSVASCDRRLICKCGQRDRF
jgi:hypothetical protein